MWYSIKSYLLFLLKSNNQHGIHSPFVYNLITQCFYDKTQYLEYKTLEQFRKSLLQHQGIIEITDFGEGSRVFSTNHRKVAAIAKNAGISKKRQQLLFRITRYFKSKNILELGTSIGLATTALALANQKTNIITIEGCKNTSAIAQEFFNKYHLHNIQLVNRTFEYFFKQKKNIKYDLVYIDGNHNKDKTLFYFNQLLPHTTNDSLFILDDIYWSKTMTEAWKTICQHPQVTVSIDCFYWGIIFFRKEQQKQHFTIRL
ncbi:MAG: O-methyltransferase [Flavobacteriales bacterium]